MPDHSNLKKVYDRLIADGKFDMPSTYEEFEADMAVNQNMQNFYTNLRKDKTYGMPTSYQQFRADMGFDDYAQPVQNQPAATAGQSAGRDAMPAQPTWRETSAMPDDVRQRFERQEQRGREERAKRAAMGKAEVGYSAQAMQRKQEEQERERQKQMHDNPTHTLTNRQRRGAYPGDTGIFSGTTGISGDAQAELNRRVARKAAEDTLPIVYSDAVNEKIGETVEERAQELGTASDWVRRLKEEDARQKQDISDQVDSMLGEVESMLSTAVERDDAAAREKDESKSLWERVGETLAAQESVNPTAARMVQYGDDVRELQAAKRKLQSAQRTIEEAQRHAGDPAWLAEFGRGLGHGLSDISTWDFGITDLANNNAIQKALEKHDRIAVAEAFGGTADEKMTPAEQALLDAVATEVIVNEYFGSDISNWYKGGSSAAVSIPFMASMIVSPAMAAGRSASAAMARYITKRFASQAAKSGAHTVASKVAEGALKASSRVAIDATSAALHTAMFNPLQIDAGTKERMRGQVVPTFDKEGNIKYGGHINGKSEDVARREAATAAFIDNMSEMIGGWIPGFKILFGKAKWANKLVKNKYVAPILNIERRAEFHGMLVEGFEEVIRGIMNAGMVGDQTLDSDPETGVFSKDNLGTIAISIGATTVAFGCARLGAYGASVRQLHKTDVKAARLFGDEWADLKSRLQSDNMADVESAADEIARSDQYSAEQKSAAAAYASLYTGINAYKYADTEDVSVDAKNANDTFESAYEDATSVEARGDIYNMMEESRDAVRQTLGEGILRLMEDYDPLTVKQTLEETQQLTDEQAVALANYVAAHSAMSGVVQRIDDDADDVAEVQRTEAAKRRFQDEGNMQGSVRPAKALIDGKEAEVFLVSGEVALTADGSLVDPEKTKEINAVGTIVVYDPQQDKNVQIHASQIVSLEPATSAEEQEQGIEANKEAMIQAQREEIEASARDRVDSGDRDNRDNGGNREWYAEGAPKDYLPGMKLRIREEDGSEKEAKVVGRVSYEGGQWVADDNGAVVEYTVDGEVRRDWSKDLDKKVVSHVEVPVEETEEVLEPTDEDVQTERSIDTAVIDPMTMTDEERKKRGDMLRNADVVVVEPNQITSTQDKSARKAAEEWWDANVGEPQVYDTEVGEVTINRKSIETSLAHRYGQMKLDALTSLVDGFENAVYLGTMPDAERRATQNHYFAYPIEYNGKRCYVFCRALHDNNTNRLHVHEVFVEENIKKGNTLQTAASKPHGGISLYRDILANVLDEADREDGQLLILPSSKEEVGALSDPTGGMPFGSKGTNISETDQIKNASGGSTGGYMPMKAVGKGKQEVEDWYSTTPENAYSYLYEEAVGLGLPVETADNMVSQNLKKAQKEVEKSKTATGSIVSVLQKQKAAREAVEYWEKVRSIRNKQLLAEADEREAAEREEKERRRAEIESARKRDQEAYEAEMARRRAEQEKRSKELEAQLETLSQISEEQRGAGVDFPIENDEIAMQEMNDLKPRTLEEERRQRILADGTEYDKPFGLTPVSDTMTPEEIGANVRRIVDGLKSNEGNGTLDIFEGFAYKGNYKKNAGHQVDGYLLSLDGVVPNETLRQWYESEGLKTRDDLRTMGERLYAGMPRQQKTGGEAKKTGKRDKAILNAVLDKLRAALGKGRVVTRLTEAERALIDWANARTMNFAVSKRRLERDEQNRKIDDATAFVTGKDIKDVRAERIEREEKRRERAQEVYEIILSGEYNDVSLQKISDFIDDVTPRNPYGRRLSERLPQRVERALYERERSCAIDALYSRAAEIAIPANERAGSAGKRAVAEKKKELLEQWAKATGNWHTDLKDFTEHTEAVSDDTTDSDVYMSNDGAHVIKLSRGKQDKRFGSDIDAVPLFNYVFPNSAYKILGYGDFGKGFVRVLEQPAVNFENSTPLTEAERVEYMASLGFKPIGKGNTAFSNGEIVVADLQGNNIVRDADGNIRVIDADCKLHTKDVGGKYDYLPVEHDMPMRGNPMFHKVYHGSGADFDRFDHSHMGEGEGAQAYGWGTYVTEVKGIGRTYAKSYRMHNQDVYDDIEDFRIRNSYELKNDFNVYATSTIDDLRESIEDYRKTRDESVGFEDDYNYLDNQVKRGEILLKEWEQLEAKLSPAILYTVDIPDDNGGNYLEWDKSIKQKQLTKIASLFGKEKGKEYGSYIRSKGGSYGENIYYELYTSFGSQEEASKFLSRAGFTGIKYPAEYRSGGREDGAKNYVIFDEGDLAITDKVKFFKTPQGEVYGFTVGGKIYIDTTIAKADTPIHEYAHLWVQMVRESDPEAWQRIKEVLTKDKTVQPFMDIVRKRYPELSEEGKEDEFMEEVLSHFSGAKGLERLEDAANEYEEQDGQGIISKAKAMAALNKVKEALERFWGKVAELLGVEFRNAQDIADKVLSDLLQGVDPTNLREELAKAREKAYMEAVNNHVDKEYAEAVSADDKEKVDAMLREEMQRKGYTEDRDYQGTSAFNGKAPSRNGYHETRAERKEAFDNGEMEGEFSLGDFIEAGIDTHDLEWQIAHPNAASAGEEETLESINNLRSAVRGKKGIIKMYRSVPADVKEGSFRNGDWITPSRKYAEENAYVHGWDDYRIIEQEVSVDDVWWDGNDINEWGYDDGKGYAYKNDENNRKLMEATYDDNGNLIPLSKRFDSGKEDIRYHFAGERGAAAADKAEERRNSLAEETEDVAREDQIFLFGNGGESTTMSNEEIEAANSRFNEELDDFTFDNADNIVFNLGRPSDKLLSGGVENRPIKLYGSKVAKKMRKHGFSAEDLRDLPISVANPIAVFENIDREGNRSVLTELHTKQGNILVSIDLGKGSDADFDIVSSVFGKNGKGVVDWINNGKLRYVDKEKAMNYLHLSAPIAEALDNSELLQAAKIVKDFETAKNNLQGNENELGVSAENDGGIRFHKADDGGIGRVGELSEENLADAGALEEDIVSIGGRLSDLRKAMGSQKRFDIGTAKRVSDLARELIDGGKMDPLRAADVKRLLGQVWSATGKDDIEKNLRKVVDIMIDGQLRMAEEMLHKLESVRGSRVDAKGVNVQGRLDVSGQRMVETFKKSKHMQQDTLKERMADAMERMGSDDGVVANEAAQEYEGMMLANEYIDKVSASEADEDEMYRKIREEERRIYDYSSAPEVDDEGNVVMKRDGSGPRTRTVRHTKPEFKAPMSDENKETKRQVKEAVEAIEEAILENKARRLRDYMDIVGRLSGKMKESVSRAKEWRESEQERVREIQHNAKREAVERLGKRFGVDIEVVENPDDIKHTNPAEQEKMRKAPGFYRLGSGKVVIVLPNNRDVKDTVATVMHEVLTHKGLREVIGEENMPAFLDEVYSHLSDELKQRVDTKMTQEFINDIKGGIDQARRVATEEMIADISQKMPEEMTEKERNLWQKICDAVRKIIDRLFTELKLPKNYKVTENDIRYMIWKTRQHMEGRKPDYVEMAQDVNKRNELGLDDEIIYSDQNPYDDVPRAAARESYERMLESASMQFTEAMQDSMLSLKNLYKAVLEGEGKGKVNIEDVAGYENAYLAENRMASSSEAQVAAWKKDHMEPLTKAIYELTQGDKAAYDALTDYMMAKHGLERNVVLAERDAKKAAASGKDYDSELQKNRERDYAGLTALTEKDDVAEAEDEARVMVSEYEATHDAASIDRLWNAVKSATQSSLYKVAESGMMSPERFADVRGMFDYYIPLQGFDSKVAEDVYAYMGSDGTTGYGTPIRTAKGRKSKADDPIATISMNGEAAIRKGNRNIMKNHFLRFVEAHPSDVVSVSDVWLRYNDVTGQWEQYFDAGLTEGDSAAEVNRKLEAFEKKMEMAAASDPDHYKRGRDLPNVPYRVINTRDMSQHQVMVMRGGETVVMTINGNPRAAQALNGLANPDVFTEGVLGKTINAGKWINRKLSALYTTRNPEFVLSNFLRDALYSNSMMWVKESPNYALKFHKNFGECNPFAMGRLFAQWENGKLRERVRSGTASGTERLFYDFMMNGGETGWTSLRDIERHKKDLEKALTMEGSTTRKAWKALGGCFDLMNRSVENCARFAAFMTSREMGRGIERSIWDAKEVSVNFNKKGAGDKFLSAKNQKFFGKLGAAVSGSGRSLYVFFDAAVQGLNNLSRATRRHPWKAVGGLFGTLFTLGAAVPLISILLAGDDDDDKNAYYNLPEYIRRSNMCFRWSKSMPWITIPLPIEFRAIYGMGELAAGVLTGNERYSDEELVKQYVSQMSQVLPLDFMEGGGGWHAFVPSAIKPFVEAERNVGWTGLPIYRDNTFTPHDPQWKRAYSNADKNLVEFTRWLNEATGGDDVVQGFIDWNPAKIEYMLKGYLGGPYTMYNRLKKSAETAFGDREFEWRNIPMASRVLKEGDERTEARKITNEYFKYKDEYEKTKHDLKGYEKEADSDRKDALKYAEKLAFLENSKDYTKYLVMDNYKPLLDAYYKLKEEADGEEKVRLGKEEAALRRQCVETLRAIDNGKEIDVDSEMEALIDSMLDYDKLDEGIRKKAVNVHNKIAKRAAARDYDAEQEGRE